jgi:hypothetical protein
LAASFFGAAVFVACAFFAASPFGTAAPAVVLARESLSAALVFPFRSPIVILKKQ